MKRFGLILLFGAVLLAGCGTTRDVAVTSYHVTRDVAVGSYRVATAPVHYALRKRGGESEMATTTETVPSDVNQPGQPVPPEVASAPQQRPRSAREGTQSTSASAPQTARRETASSSSQRKVSSPQSEFPTAKAVPGKPGYVFSPFDADKRYVDVSGYASGSKVKDPWTDKIFVVP